MIKYLLNYSVEATSKPTLSMAVKKTGVLVNILVAKIDYDEGQMLISIEKKEKDREKLIKYLSQHGVDVKKIEGEIEKNEEQCIDCQSCYGVCPTKAILIKEQEMVLDNSECISCKACITACPTKALNIHNPEI